MPETVGQSLENWLRKNHWNPILTYFGLVIALICFGFSVGYNMTDKHPYWGSLLFFAALVLLIAGAWHAWRESHSIKWTCTTAALVLFGVGDYYWIRSLNQPVPWMVSYIVGHVAWALVLILGFLLLATFIKRSKEAELQSTVPAQETQQESTTREVQKKPVLPLPLPELRPRIVAVSYSRIASVPALGFVTANDGEPAYEVSIPNVRLGTSTVIFEGNCPRIGPNTTTEWRVLIKQETGGMSTGNELRNEMLRQGIGEVVVSIRYRDGNGLSYVSHCRIELASGGTSVRNNGQELVSGKSAQSTPSLPETAPRPYLEVEDPIDERFGKTLFHFTNRGRDVAHNVQVQPLSINRLTVVFDPIPILPINESKSTVPTIPGIGIMEGHDILNLMEKEWEEAYSSGILAHQDHIEEWKTDLTVTYGDFTGKPFEMTCDLVVFPMQRDLRNRNALQLPRNKYQTVEVRNIKFKSVGESS